LLDREKPVILRILIGTFIKHDINQIPTPSHIDDNLIFFLFLRIQVPSSAGGAVI
jgi:uncharacterized ion transporter superfamily protein YfcC